MATASKNNSGSAQAVVMERNDFYRSGYKSRGKIIMGLVVALSLSSGGNYLQATKKPEVLSFAVTTDGRIIPITPLGSPLDNPQTVINFAGEAAQAAFHLDFVNYRDQLSKMRQYMTKESYESFLNKLEESNNVDTIKKMQLVSTATLSAPPVITKEGVVNGIYRWKIEAPVLVSMQGRGGYTDSLLITMQVRRAAITDNPKALAIEQFIVEKAVAR